MGGISKTLDRIEKITSIFSHLKNLLIVICIIVVLVLAWRMWKWMDTTSQNIPNREAVMTTVSDVRSKIGEIELPTLPDGTVVRDQYEAAKDKAAQVMTYRPDWLSSGHTNKTEESQPAANSDQPQANASGDAEESETQGATTAETTSPSYSSRLGVLGERIGGALDQVDGSVQGVQEAVTPLLNRVEDFTLAWGKKDDASKEEVNPQTQDSETQVSSDADLTQGAEEASQEVVEEVPSTTRSSSRSSSSSSSLRRAIDFFD